MNTEISSTISFVDQLETIWEKHNSLLCIGLDPDTTQLPVSLTGTGGVLFAFCRAIVDATAALACAFKPQIAYFSAQHAEDQLQQLIHYIHEAYPGIPVILDAKRGDIGKTAEQYAREAFERYQADALTVNPYLGFDSLQPYLEWSDKGIILLCRTSNQGGSDLQSLCIDGQPLYQKVAQLAAQSWNINGQMGLVVGATFPEDILKVRNIVGNMPLLVPGIGTQGGDIESIVKAGQTARGDGMIINSSRAILYASSGEDFAQAAAIAARTVRDQINQWRKCIIEN